MNLQYSIALCLALFVPMLAVDIALRIMIRNSRTKLVEINDYYSSKHREFHVRALHLFSTHINSPYYVALNFA